MQTKEMIKKLSKTAVTFWYWNTKEHYQEALTVWLENVKANSDELPTFTATTRGNISKQLLNNYSIKKLSNKKIQFNYTTAVRAILNSENK